MYLKIRRGRCVESLAGKIQLWQEPQWQPLSQGVPKNEHPFCRTVVNTALAGRWQIFEAMGQGLFDIERQSLIMDKNQMDIHRVINKLCVCTHREGQEHFSEAKEIKSAKQKLKMDLFSRASGYVMNASVCGLNPSVSWGVIHAWAKRLWNGPGSHFSSSDLCSEISS